MSFRPMLRPGQGFKWFNVLRKEGGLAASGRPKASGRDTACGFYGMLTDATPKEIEQHKQEGHPVTHTIVQRGTENRAKATDILVLGEGDTARWFKVHKEPKDPGALGHFLVYAVEERADLQ